MCICELATPRSQADCGVFQVNRESADRETQMVSVERVQNYVTNVKQAA
jgi:hypothetical protein